MGHNTVSDGVAMVNSPFASVEGVFDFPCSRRGWVGKIMAPSFGIRWVFTIVNVQDVVALPTFNV
jgi:hypothetical protein